MKTQALTLRISMVDNGYITEISRVVPDGPTQTFVSRAAGEVRSTAMERIGDSIHSMLDALREEGE